MALDTWGSGCETNVPKLGPGYNFLEQKGDANLEEVQILNS